MTRDDVPLLEIQGLVKQYGSLRPLRIASLTVRSGDRVTLSGLDAEAAEMFIHLVTGASLADEGVVTIAGQDTRAIATDTDWLTSLDRFGLVTDRAVLLEKLPIASNLALPLTVTIDPPSPAVRARVDALAREVGLAPGRLDEAAGSLSPAERVRVHLARALASDPQLLLLEHPTARVGDTAASVELGATLRRAADTRGIAWIIVTEDQALAKASGGYHLRLEPATGKLHRDGRWARVLRQLNGWRGGL